MKTVTGLAPQKRDKQRVNVYLDNEFAFGLSVEVAETLKIGQVLSAEDIQRIWVSESVAKAKERIYRLLSYRPRSSEEVRRRLSEAGIDQTIVEAALEQLSKTSLLDDRKFAEYWIEQRQNFRPKGRLALQHELYEKGIGRGLIDEVLRDYDEVSAARNAIGNKSEKWLQLDQRSLHRKVVGYLKRRGFDFDTIATLARELEQMRASK